MTRPEIDTIENVPLFGGDACPGCGDETSMEFDEDGSLALARALGLGTRPTAAARGDEVAPPGKPCKVSVLNGSWYLQLTPRGPHALTEIRGPMRIEVAAPKLRVSGDVYVRKPTAHVGPI